MRTQLLITLVLYHLSYCEAAAAREPKVFVVTPEPRSDDNSPPPFLPTPLPPEKVDKNNGTGRAIYSRPSPDLVFADFKASSSADKVLSVKDMLNHEKVRTITRKPIVSTVVKQEPQLKDVWDIIRHNEDMESKKTTTSTTETVWQVPVASKNYAVETVSSISGKEKHSVYRQEAVQNRTRNPQQEESDDIPRAIRVSDTNSNWAFPSSRTPSSSSNQRYPINSYNYQNDNLYTTVDDAKYDLRPAPGEVEERYNPAKPYLPPRPPQPRPQPRPPPPTPAAAKPPPPMPPPPVPMPPPPPPPPPPKMLNPPPMMYDSPDQYASYNYPKPPSFPPSDSGPYDYPVPSPPASPPADSGPYDYPVPSPPADSGPYDYPVPSPPAPPPSAPEDHHHHHHHDHPPPPDMPAPDTSGPAATAGDETYPPLEFDHDHHDPHHLSDYHDFYEHHEHHPPPTTTTTTTAAPEEKRVNNRYSYYYLGKKLCASNTAPIQRHNPKLQANGRTYQDRSYNRAYDSYDTYNSYNVQDNKYRNGYRYKYNTRPVTKVVQDRFNPAPPYLPPAPPAMMAPAPPAPAPPAPPPPPQSPPTSYDSPPDSSSYPDSPPSDNPPDDFTSYNFKLPPSDAKPDTDFYPAFDHHHHHHHPDVDFSDLHEFYHDHHIHHPPPPPTTTLPPPPVVHKHISRPIGFFLSKKYLMSPLYGTVFIVGYVAWLLFRSILRNKIVYPQHYKNRRSVEWKPTPETMYYWTTLLASAIKKYANN